MGIILRRISTVFSSLLLSVLSLSAIPAQAAVGVLPLIVVNAEEPDLYSIGFSHDDSEAFYGGGSGGTSIRRILSSNLVDAGTPVPRASDGFADSRTVFLNWQVAEITSSQAAGKNGHYWTYASGSNSRVNGHGVVWAVDQSTYVVEPIELKITDETWSSGGIGWVTATPNGKYVYAYSWDGYIFKIDAMTNQQIGLGVLESFSNFVASNDFLYISAPSGIRKIAIDGDNSKSTGDSESVPQVITGSASEFAFGSIDSGMTIFSGHLYLTSAYEATMAVIDLATFEGDSWVIDAAYPYGWENGEVGADNYFYVSNYDYGMIAKVDLNTKSLVSVTDAIAGSNIWQSAMNNSRTKFVSASDSSYNALYVVNISASPRGVNPYDTEVHEDVPGSATASDPVEEARIAAAERAQALAKARTDVVISLVAGKPLTADQLLSAEIPGATAKNIEGINTDISNLSAELRSDISQIAKIVRKYEVVDLIASSKISSVMPQTLIEIGLISADNKSKTAVTIALRKLPVEKRSDYASIAAAITQELAKIQSRKDRLAAVVTRTVKR